MAFILKLYNGDNNYTVDFMDLDFLLADGGLEIPPAEKNELFTNDTVFVQGTEPIAYSYKNRKIRIKCRVTGSTRSVLLSNVSKINKILETALYNRVLKNNVHTELQYAWDSVSVISYFDVLGGELKWPNNVMSVEQVHQKDGRGHYVIYDFEIELLVAPFASSVSYVNGSLVSLALNSYDVGGAGVTTGITLTNAVTPPGVSKGNYVQISGANIPGDAPTQAKITIKNLDSGVVHYPPIIISSCRQLFNNNQFDSVNAAYKLGTDTADANAVGTTTMVASTSSTTPVELIRWGFTGAPFGLFSVFLVGGALNSGSTIPFSASASYRVRLSYSINGPFWYGDWVVGSGLVKPLLSLGTLFYPPGYQSNVVVADNMYLSVEVKSNTGASVTTYVDRLHMFPIRDGYRFVGANPDSFFINNTESIVDDPYLSSVYRLNGSGNKNDSSVGFFKEIELLPGKDHTLHFLLGNTWYTKWASGSFSVKIEVIPRFLGLAY